MGPLTGSVLKFGPDGVWSEFGTPSGSIGGPVPGGIRVRSSSGSGGDPDPDLVQVRPSDLQAFVLDPGHPGSGYIRIRLFINSQSGFFRADRMAPG